MSYLSSLNLQFIPFYSTHRYHWILESVILIWATPIPLFPHSTEEFIFMFLILQILSFCFSVCPWCGSLDPIDKTVNAIIIQLLLRLIFQVGISSSHLPTALLCQWLTLDLIVKIKPPLLVADSHYIPSESSMYDRHAVFSREIVHPIWFNFQLFTYYLDNVLLFPHLWYKDNNSTKWLNI